MSRSVQWVGLTTLAIAVIALAIFMSDGGERPPR
jgi:hypothetical protein